MVDGYNYPGGEGCWWDLGVLRVSYSRQKGERPYTEWRASVQLDLDEGELATSRTPEGLANALRATARLVLATADQVAGLTPDLPPEREDPYRALPALAHPPPEIAGK